MSVRILGMLGVSRPSDVAVNVIEGDMSPDWIATHAREHEAAGYDEVLVGYTSRSAEGFGVAGWAAAATEKLSFLMAHRPGLIQPALMARKIATFDRLTSGRMTLHVIIGATDANMQMEGDFLGKESRYERGAEYVRLMRALWTSEGPIDFDGKYYKVRQAFSEIKPYQKPHPLIAFGGSSQGALEMGASQCDIFAMFGEPLKDTRERVDAFRQMCAAHGRTPKFNMSFRPIIADTEGRAWDKARALLEVVKRDTPSGANPVTEGKKRLVEFAHAAEVHDTCFWTPMATATVAEGNTTCLVGTPKQVADALLKYYELGVHSFLIRGFSPVDDVQDFGRELIPRVRQGAIELDSSAASAKPLERRAVEANN